MKKFNNEVDFTESRYQIKLPYKENLQILGDNFELCKKHLKDLTRKFEYNKNLLAEYCHVFKEQKTDYIIEKTPSYHNLGKTHYSPHKPVIRYDKATTKLRMVFDFSTM